MPGKGTPEKIGCGRKRIQEKKGKERLLEAKQK